MSWKNCQFGIFWIGKNLDNIHFKNVNDDTKADREIKFKKGNDNQEGGRAII